ncbi:MAG: hypothetical protein GKR88_21325 [Flavobacteriaceae bacterium]|nr:MAG: hypothetical protein GKR88_21325 [Flavobacteriaceae bacterium]
MIGTVIYSFFEPIIRLHHAKGELFFWTYFDKLNTGFLPLCGGAFSFFALLRRGVFGRFSVVILQTFLQVNFCRFMDDFCFISRLYQSKNKVFFWAFLPLCGGLFFFLLCSTVQFLGLFLGFQPDLF